MSSWHLDQLKYGLGLSGLVTFYGVVSLIVYFVGDRFGYSMTYRIVIVAIVLLTLPIALVIGFVATRKKKKVEAAAEAEAQAAAPAAENDGKPAANLNQPSGKYEDLTAGADSAVLFLRTSNLGGDGNGNGKDAVYALPFFLFAGTPRSGKSSLVQSSGLNFQTLPDQRQSEQNFIRPTRHVDWRVASDAVLIDTAGRYQTEGVDADEWSALLETLKKHRGNRPLDGLVLVANTEKILAADETEIEHQAKLLRNRLDEAMQRTRLRFPVYLVFTGSDAIEGFRDSFSVSQKEGKNLILGATFPLEKTANAASLFDAEFEALQQSLLQRRLLRLSAPFPPARQLRIFNFPAHFAASRRKLGAFVTALFRPNPFSESPMFRGFYFTASVPQKMQQRGVAEGAPPVQTVGASYFSERFFRDILLRDGKLVATFQAQKQRPPVLGWILLGAGALVTLFLLAMSLVSLFANRALLAEATASGQRVSEIVKADRGRDPLTKSATEARNEIEATDELRRTVAKLNDYERNGAPVYMRLGLYSGYDVFHKRLLPTYFAVIEQRYKKPVVQRLEDDLRAFSSNQTQYTPASLSEDQEKELGKYYDLLKAYLMLSGDYRNRAEPTFLSNQLEDYWKKSSPGELESLSQQQLLFYANQIDREEFPRIQLDKNLVDTVRKRLQAYPPVFRYYKRVTTDISKKIDPVSVNSVLALRSSNVLEGSYEVPGSYTAEGYRREMRKAISGAQSEISKDDWVMGDRTVSITATNEDVSRLETRYANDYADHWRKFLKGVNVIKIDSTDDAGRVFQALSSNESPVAIVLREVARNTNLAAKPKPKDWWSWFASFFDFSAATDFTSSNSKLIATLEKDFKPLFVFIGDEENSSAAPVSKYQKAAKDVDDIVSGISENKKNEISKDLAAEVEKGPAGRIRTAEKSVDNLGQALQTPAGAEVAGLLSKPFQNLRVFFGADAKEQLERTWRNQLFVKAQEIEKGYPFSDSGEADLQKLTAFLNPASGKPTDNLSKFYEQQLAKYFEEANGQLKPKESSNLQFSKEFVDYLNNAFKLREALFGKGATPNFEYEFKLQPVKDAIIEASIDGNKPLTSAGSSSAKFKFPASSGGETGAVLQFTSTADPVSTAGSTLGGANANSAANSAAANVGTTAGTNARNNFAQAVNNASANSASASETSKRFSGQWGLFKMFEAGAPQKQNGEYVLTYKVGTKTVIANVRPTGGDLFDRSIFRNVRAPQTMLKQ